MRSNVTSFLPLLACFSGLLIGYDTGIIGSALLFIQPHFHVTQSFQGIIASIVIPGIMIGILLVSIISHYFEPLRFLRAATLIYLVGYLIIATTFTTSLLLVGRLFAGIAIGILFVIVPMYLAETAHEKFRGRFVAVFQLAITLGIFLGYLTSYWLAHYAAWRWMFCLGLLGALILLIASIYLPLSSHPFKKPVTEKLNIFRYPRPFIIGIGLGILQQVTGINAILYFAPQILLSIQPQSNTTAISSALIIAGGNFLFTIVSLFLLDSIGRRPMLLFSLLCQCVALGLLGSFYYLAIPAETHLYFFCLLIYFFGFAVGLGPITWLIIAEIYPASIRGKAIGLTVMINNIAAFAVSGCFLMVLNKIGVTLLFWGFSLIALLGLFFVWRFIPETKQQSLDDIQLKLTQ